MERYVAALVVIWAIGIVAFTINKLFEELEFFVIVLLVMAVADLVTIIKILNYAWGQIYDIISKNINISDTQLETQIILIAITITLSLIIQIGIGNTIGSVINEFIDKVLCKRNKL